MTEDLHNDIDDLFRSGLEGKEDTPSPDVWAAIAKGLPATPPSAAAPSVPGATPPPAVGGGTSTIILKGLIGAAIVAVVGTAVYFMTVKEKNTVETEVTVNPTESSEIHQPLKSIEPTGVGTNEPEADNAPPHPQASNNKKEATYKASTETEKAEPTTPDADIRDQRPGSEKGTAVKEEVLQGFATRPEIPAPGTTAKNNRLSEVTKTHIPAGIKPSSPLRFSNESFRTPASSIDNRSADRPVENGLAPTSGTSKVMPAQAEVAMDRRNWTSNLKAVNSFRISAAAPATALTVLPAMLAPSESAPAAAKGGSAPLKRNDWRSKIYLTPVVSLNMTTMEVEENRAFGSRLGREHIEFRETEETRTTLSPGLIAGFALTPRFSVQTGVSELRNNISVSPKEIKAVRDRDGKVRYRMDCSSGSYFLEPKLGTSPAVGDSLRIASSEIKMRYVTIPLSVRVNLGNDRVRIFATAGADINMLASKQTSTSLSALSTDKVSPVRSEGTRKQYLNGTLGGGVEIKAGKRLGIMLMPQYRFPLGNINEEGPVLTYPKTFSITSGVRIGF